MTGRLYENVYDPRDILDYEKNIEDEE